MALCAAVSCSSAEEEPLPETRSEVAVNIDTLVLQYVSDEYVSEHAEASYRPTGRNWYISEFFTDTTYIPIASDIFCDTADNRRHFEKYTVETRSGELRVSAPTFELWDIPVEEWGDFSEPGNLPSRKFNLQLCYPGDRYDTIVVVQPCKMAVAGGIGITFNTDNAVFTVNGGTRILKGTDDEWFLETAIVDGVSLAGWNPGSGSQRKGEVTKGWLTLRAEGCNLIIEAERNTTGNARGATLFLFSYSRRAIIFVLQSGK